MPLRKWNPGCPCCCEATITVTVTQCDPYGNPTTPVAGAIVTATKGSATVTGTTDASGVVVLTVHAAGDWAIHVDASSAGFGTANGTVTTVCGSDSPIHLCVGPAETIPGCVCPSIPAILDMTVLAACTGGFYQSDTIRWGPTPAAYSTLGLGTSCFLGDTTFLDDVGQEYRWYFTCSSNLMTIHRVWANNLGSPAKSPAYYTWDGTDPANSCSPFVLIAGTVYTGGIAACNNNVHITDGT